MKKLICLFAVIAMILSICPVMAADSATAIEKLNKIGIITGDENGNLNADAAISRTEFLALVLRASGLEEEAKAAAEKDTVFEDAKGHWGQGYINVAAEKGIVNGISETEFGTEAAVTFNQAVKMAVAMINFQETAEEAGGYPDGYLATAEELGILDGIKVKEREITRDEAAEIIYAAMNVFVLNSDGTIGTDDILATLNYVDTEDEVLKVEKETFDLWGDNEVPFYNEEAGLAPVVKAYVVEGEDRPAVVYFPGGAYHHMSNKESQQIPKILNRIGISVFVVEYRVTPYTDEAIMADGFRAVRYVRANAGKYNLDPEKIGVMGTSAGGHLAATVSTLYEGAAENLGDEIDKVSARPDFSILCYPVVTFEDEFTHKDSRNNFLGQNVTDEMIEKYSCEKNVNENTPPAFIWHTAADTAVPVENSINYGAALAAYDIPFEMHIYPIGGHGLAAGIGQIRVEEWPDNLNGWLKAMEIID